MHQAAQLYIFQRLALLPQVVQLLGDILLDVSVPAGRVLLHDLNNLL